MKQLIVNADDFGRHPLINQAVAQAVEQKGLLSASIMAGKEYFNEAVAIAKACPQLGIGVHLTLVDGRPVLSAEAIPSLVAENGDFWPDHGVFVKRFVQGKISLREIQKELAAQMDKVLSAGLHPTHVDSHQHLHMLPGIFPLVLSLAAERGIKRVRISRGIYGNPFTPWPGMGDLIGKFGLEALACRNRWLVQKRGFVCPDNFVGQVAGGAVSAEFMLDLAEKLVRGTVEVMLHPGLDNDVLAKETGWQHDYEGEYRAVCQPFVQDALAEKGIELVNFGDL
ncbi:MAG: ChbG/HpnK family deacetylase [Selenomonas sp.]|uniref:carbohydrate deacetylase n=1 Tax=Selenomonas sp. TaxID=2053611 RepID=UPI0025F58184|nr:ChbG/HpnK family deacetylase [Selenomonas sp.]MCR5758701.1 ChbG/HpnK family deacetylase [Selenomonas sp.]